MDIVLGDTMDHRIDKFFAAEYAGLRLIQRGHVPLPRSGRHVHGKSLAGGIFSRPEKPQDRVNVDRPRQLEPEVRPMAAVRIILRPLDHLCTDRIEVNVSHQLGKICVRLAKYRFMPPLQQMPRPAVLAVVILCVARQHPMHDPPDIVSPPLDQQMNVIGHQAVGVQIEWQLCLLIGQQCEKLLPVLRRMKNVSPLNPSRYHMIKRALDLYPRFSSHLINDTIQFKSYVLFNEESTK